MCNAFASNELWDLVSQKTLASSFENVPLPLVNIIVLFDKLKGFEDDLQLLTC